MTNPNYVPERDLEYDRRYAGLTRPGQYVHTYDVPPDTDHWRKVLTVTFPPETAAVVALTIEGRARPIRLHADDLVKVCG